MIKQIIDLHIHSKYSRACSKDLELPKIVVACVGKGIDIVATSDFTHPLWWQHIKDCLQEENSGMFVLKSDQQKLVDSYIEDSDIALPKNISSRLAFPAGEVTLSGIDKVRFILSTEISCIYKHKDATRRLHLIILAPDFSAVEKFNGALEKRGVNLKSDGRPIMGLQAKEILKIMLDIDDRMMMIPAHAWTPWFSVFGSKSGYGSLEQCFEELTPHVRAIETGLSSDPMMNHRLSALDKITLVSNSDAHSLNNLGREANVFAFEDEKKITYDEIKRIIETGDKEKFLYTIEFYPEEGKYHCDGHRECKICLEPKETKKANYICSKCKKKVTVGVLHRIDDLADRELNDIKKDKFISHKYIVPLREIIGRVFSVGSKSKKVNHEYEKMIRNIGNEFYVLISASQKEIMENTSNKNIWIAINNMRQEKVKVKPGYDGEFGLVDVLPEGIIKPNQNRLF
ncbi:MAG: endonuclease Q family protein [bacterium]